MLSIRQLAQLLGIAPQTIRMYEQYGIFEAHRTEANYRKFDRPVISKLIKSRMLQGMGLSMKEIAGISKGISYEESKKLLSAQEEALETEIRLLEEKRQRVANLRNEMAEIQQKQGTCEMVTSPAFYFHPVLENNRILLNKGGDLTYLEKWNEYAFVRQDVNDICPETLMNGEHADEYRILYGVTAADAQRYGLDVSQAIYCPARQCVKAYAVHPADSDASFHDIFRFAADYIRENKLQVVYDPLVFLPFWPQDGKLENYFYMLIPVEKEA